MKDEQVNIFIKTLENELNKLYKKCQCLQEQINELVILVNKRHESLLKQF